MARVTFNAEQIAQSKILPPGWYPYVTKSFEESQAGTDGSALYIFQLLITDGPFKGAVIRYQISEKLFLSEFFEFLAVSGIDVKPGVQIELEKTVGKGGEVFSQRGEYKGRPQNTPVSFRSRKVEGVA